jgi:murein DD-endopeptidase MepM/ murein hydrolase activator NlpD
LRKLGIWVVVILTAVVTAALTSLFWIAVYSWAGEPGVQQSGDKVVLPANKERGGIQVAEAVVVGPAGLAVPVTGIRPSELVDTYTQARAGGARVHDAIDIMAPHGRPVVAAAPGRVEKLFNSQGGGGITAYIRSNDGQWIYYYAHLQRYRPGLAEGQRVNRGDVIGTVGSTGNANPAGPHLHFAIHRMQPGEDWHEGTPVNPYPLLAGNRPAR